MSAEEEAEERKKELMLLKSSKKEEIEVLVDSASDGVNINNVDDNIHQSVIVNETISGNTLFHKYVIFAHYPCSEESIVNSSIATPKKRFGSVLETANPDMINCLNKIFSPNSSGVKSKFESSGHFLSPQTIKPTKLTTITVADNKEIKTTRSKLLQV